MPLGRKSLRRLQIALETTSGTPVAATTRLRVKDAVLKDQREVEEILEQIGILGDGADRTAIPKLIGMLDIPAQPMSFEQWQYFMAMSMGGPTTGAADGAGSGRIYTTTIPTTTAPSIGGSPNLRSYTFEGGDDSEVERMEYGVCIKWEISGQASETLKFSSTIMGRQVQRLAGGFAAATIPTIEDILVSKGILALDAIGGTYGATPISNQILGIKITGDIKLIPKFTMDGQLYYTFPVYTNHIITGEVTFEHDVAAQGNTGAKADWRAQTPKLLQVNFSGNALTSAGTTYSVKKLIFNLPIKWKQIGGLEDKEGNDIVKAQFRSRYNTTAGNAGSIICVHEVSPLP